MAENKSAQKLAQVSHGQTSSASASKAGAELGKLTPHEARVEGGHARSENMSSSERKSSGYHAAMKRWHK